MYVDPYNFKYSPRDCGIHLLKPHSLLTEATLLITSSVIVHLCEGIFHSQGESGIPSLNLS